MSGTVPPSPRLHPAIRAAVAIACGLVVGSLAYVHAWKTSRHNYFLFSKNYLALDDMSRISSSLEKHLEDTRKLPVDLVDLELPSGVQLTRDVAGAPLDPWGHPYSYRATGDDWELLSFAQDGAPGGVGLDADIPSEPAEGFVGEATLRQFTLEQKTGGIRFACVLAALGTAVACWVLMRNAAGQPLLVQLTGWGFTLAAAWFVAQILAVLHIPSGH